MKHKISSILVTSLTLTALLTLVMYITAPSDVNDSSDSWKQSTKWSKTFRWEESGEDAAFFEVKLTRDGTNITGDHCWYAGSQSFLDCDQSESQKGKSITGTVSGLAAAIEVRSYRDEYSFPATITWDKSNTCAILWTAKPDSEELDFVMPINRSLSCIEQKLTVTPNEMKDKRYDSENFNFSFSYPNDVVLEAHESSALTDVGLYIKRKGKGDWIGSITAFPSEKNPYDSRSQSLLDYLDNSDTVSSYTTLKVNDVTGYIAQEVSFLDGSSGQAYYFPHGQNTIRLYFSPANQNDKRNAAILNSLFLGNQH